MVSAHPSPDVLINEMLNVSGLLKNFVGFDREEESPSPKIQNGLKIPEAIVVVSEKWKMLL